VSLADEIMAFAREKLAFRQAEFIQQTGAPQYMVSKTTRRLTAAGMLEKGPNGSYCLPGHAAEVPWRSNDHRNLLLLDLVARGVGTTKELMRQAGMTECQVRSRMERLRFRDVVHNTGYEYRLGPGPVKNVAMPAVDSLVDWMRKHGKPVPLRQIIGNGWGECSVRRAVYRGRLRKVDRGVYAVVESK
jgi:DNA-binding IclR family transcriptional regulator